MAKNEAKIKFTAETGEFNDSIKKSNDEMSKLRAELKLNETQMKDTGDTIEGLEDKHRILSEQLAASETKTEALSKKLEKAVEIFGQNSTEASKLEVQLLNAQTAQEKLRQAVDKCANELEDQRSAANKTETATEKLTKKIEDQKSEVNRLKDEYVDAVLEYGKTSDEAKDLEKQIKNLSDELKDNQKALGKAADAADKLDNSFENAGDAARESGDGFTVAKGAVADFVSDAVQAGIAKVGEFIDYLKDLPEATRELRQDMATLETAFETQGFSVEQAEGTWRDLYAVIGDDAQAVEASNMIAKMSKDQKDLNNWVTIATGVYGQYQDSLPIEGLAEAANETAKTGAVTGSLADALNWSSEAATMFAGYMNDEVTTAEDAFNVALSECTTEQERQTLITETLSKLYGDSATKYRDVAGAQLEAKEATAESTLAQNDLAAAVEPATTAWDGLKTELLVAVTPAITTICGKLTEALNWLKEHPTALKAVSAAFAVLAVGLGVIAVAWGVYTVVQLAANAAMLPVIGIALLVVAAIAAVVAIGVALYQNWDTIKAKCSELWTNIKTKFNEGKAAVVNKVNEIKQGVVDKFNALKNGVVEKVNALKTSATEKFNAVKNAIMKPIESARDKIKGIVDKIKGFFSGMKLSFPSVKLPHFSIKPAGWKIGDLLKGSIPKLGIEWYAKGGIFKKPTIFATGSGLKGVGEAGAEAVLPIDRLQGYISGAIEKAQNVVNLQSLANAIEDLANRPTELYIGDRQIALATASANDNVNGLRSTFRSRGLALD